MIVKSIENKFSNINGIKINHIVIPLKPSLITNEKNTDILYGIPGYLFSVILSLIY